MPFRNSAIKNKHSRGAIAVEMAILLPVLLMLALSIGEFGRAIYQYNTLTKAVRDAARFISQFNPSQADYEDKLDETRQLAAYGLGDTALAPGLSEEMVSITNNTVSGYQMVTVTITGYQFTPVINPLLLFGDIGSAITFDAIQATMRQL